MLVNYLSLGGLIYPTRLYSNVIEGILIAFSLYFWVKNKRPYLIVEEDSYKRKLLYEKMRNLIT